MIECRPITSADEWLAWRRRDVTASDVAAVFGLHHYKTRLGLWAEKSGLDVGDRVEQSVMRRGKIMEPSVAAAVALDRPEWRLTKCNDYYSDTDLRLGATPDFFVDGDPRGRGVLQAKTASRDAFEAHWTDDMPPFWIVLQNATELMLTRRRAGVKWGAVAVLVVDPWRDLVCPVYDIPSNPEAEEKVAVGVAEFWKAVDAGIQPATDYSRDASLVDSLYREEVPGMEIDLSGDNELPGLLESRARIAGEVRTGKAALDTIDTEIKSKLGAHERGFARGWTLQWKVEPRGEFYQPETRPRVLRIKKAKG